MGKGKRPTENQAAQELAALGNATRLRLFKLLVRAGQDGLNIGDLQRLLDMPASTLAHHLSMLARADLVRQERRGREVICTANYEVVNGLVAYLKDQCCTGVRVRSDAA
ncbi:MAG: ArsR/SmtB family transcription factor [Acidiferrobacterales bacterium]